MNIVTVTGFVGAFAVLLGALATILKLRPDRDVLMITQAQGASTVLNDLVVTLREEIDRERTHSKELEEENTKLRQEVEGLRKRFGTRTQDV